MLVETKKLLTAVTVATVLLTGNLAHAATGGYTPCIVQPLFVPPTMSQPIIEKADILPPTFIQSVRSHWLIERTDIEPPMMIQPVFILPRYEGCEEIGLRRRKQLAEVFATRGLSGPIGRPALNGSAAARAFTDASSTSCCGGAGGR
jgi:hypothetical protein